MSNSASARSSDTYVKIASRLLNFTPPIVIGDLIGDKLSAGRTTLDGISFVTKDTERLLMAIRHARDFSGAQAFAEGKEDPKHWALKMSFAATHGIGFREIWRPRLSDRPLSYSDARMDRYAPRWDRRFSGRFGDAQDLPDLSSLHCSVAKDICNIHIDEMGFLMTGPNGDIVVDPDFLRHILVELLWKTKLQGKIPLWALDRFNFVVPSSLNDFSRAGASFDLIQGKTYKLTLTGSCTIIGEFECSGTVTFSGTFR